MTPARWLLRRLVLQCLLALMFAAETAATVGHGPFLAGAYLAAALLIVALAGQLAIPAPRPKAV